MLLAKGSCDPIRERDGLELRGHKLHGTSTRYLENSLKRNAPHRYSICQLNIPSLYQDYCHLFNASLVLEAIPIFSFLSIEVVTVMANHKN